MDRHKRWGIYFKQHKCPCFILNSKTNEIIEHNKEFENIFTYMVGENINTLIDKDCINIEDTISNFKNNTLFENELISFKSGIDYLLRLTSQDFNNDEIFVELIPSKVKYDKSEEFEETITKCIEICENHNETGMTDIMELLCCFYKCKCAFVFRFNFDDDTISCLAQFGMFELNDINFSAIKLLELIEKQNEKGIIYIDSTTQSTQDTNIFELENISMCKIEDAHNRVIGFVGLGNKKDLNEVLDARLINTISRFVAQEVSKVQFDSNFINRDVLTGLYNRTGYAKMVDNIMSKKPKSMGVISVNVNGLKYINENAGIQKGDEHIKAVAKQLVQHFKFEFFRMSGDEFLGIAPNVCEEEFEEQALSLYSLMRNDDNYDFSFGHTWGQGKIDILKLAQEADMLMYINKQQYYSTSNRQFDSFSDTTLVDLLSYLEDDEFMIYVQPQVLLEDGTIYGAEALIRRFDKRNERMVFPNDFIPLYEQKSVIRHIDMFVLEEVCKLQAECIKKGKYIPISVNFSRVTLQEYGIVDSITVICDKYNIPHNLLVVEVTERVGLIENDVAHSLIKKFKDNGFHISLDDFGCAYSNIVTLSQIEVDEVKIDKSLVDYVISNKKNYVLVKNILSMCNELEGISTLAEGIENEEQGKMLYEIGCRLGQGYYYSRPMTIEDFMEKYID